MTTKKQVNIIIIVTDSARNFSTGLDDRDRPKFYDSLDKFVNFENAVTSAPSSVMSASTMLTGMNSYYIGRNYDDFRYEEGVFPNLASILQDVGYETKGIFVAREMREKVAPFIGSVEKENWPKGISHSLRMWSNETANEILENYLSIREDKDPLFLMVWNNIRDDLNISPNLDNLTKILIKYGYFENSIIIFTADHGYPHPRRGFTPENLKREGLTHDLMLSDDNILIPLLIKTPDNTPGSIKEQVGTIDLFPTITDYVGIESFEGKDNFPQSGSSLRPLLVGLDDQEYFGNRSIRCDCRFFGQSQRKTAIRQGQFKYVYSHDDNLEEFYDLDYDPSEDISLAKNPRYEEKLSELRKIFKDEEEKANNFQELYIARKLVSALSSSGKSKDLVVFSLQEQQMNDRIISALHDEKKLNICSFVGSVSKKELRVPVLASSLSELNKKDFFEVKESLSKGAHVIFLYSETDEKYKDGIRIIEENGIKINNKLDINFQADGDIKWGFSRYWRALVSRRKLILSEPTLLLTYAKEFIKRFLSKLW